MYEENNRILEEIRKPYDLLARNWEGSVTGLMLAARPKENEERKDTLNWLMSRMIVEKKMEKHKDGSMKGTYAIYEKTVKRMKEYFTRLHQNYYDILLADLTVDLVNDMFEDMEANGNAGRSNYVSQCLKAALNWGDKMGMFDMTRLKGVRWPKKNKESAHKYQTLTNEQCKRFIELKKSDLPTNPRNVNYTWRSQLYHDFCVFILFTCQSPCDAICLRYDDIQTINGVDHFVFKRRKIAGKQSTDCSVPINPIMKEIMKRWKKKSRDGYIFPIRNDEKTSRYKNTNQDINKFVQRSNLWLKKIGPIIGCPFNLHNYVFRHTGITHYISKGVPIIYVANLAGTSVKNCESIYYNNQGDVTSRDMVLGAVDF
jgi:integrase